MAILKMKRIEVLGMLSESKAVIDLIQQNECVEIRDVTEDTEGLFKLSTSSTVSQFEKFTGVATQALETLKGYVEKKGGFLASFAPRPDMTVSDFVAKSDETDDILEKCYSINALSKDIQDAKVEIVRAQTVIDQTRPWENLDIPFATKGTSLTKAFIGTIAEPVDREAILTRLAEVAPEADVEVEVVSSDNNQTCLVALCLKESADVVEKALASIGFATNSDTAKIEPSAQIAKLEAEIEECNKRMADDEEKIKAYADSYDDIEFLLDYLTLRTDKYEALDKISMSDNVFVLSGYIPEEKVDSLVSQLENKFDVAISVTEPDEDEDVPVLIENGTLGSTMEAVTTMYATPTQRDLDPNTAMTVFYFLLFGLMLGDAGYGLLMVIACLFVKFKYKLEPQKAKTVNYGLFCGIGTTVWGILLNGWFGDLPTYIANGLKAGDKVDFITAHHLYWFQPLEHTTRFLLLAYFIGILHLSFGLILNIYKNVKQHNVLAGIVENVPLILILVGVLPLINSQLGGTALYDNLPTRWIDNLLTTLSPVLYGCLAAGAILVVIGPAIIAIANKRPASKILGSLGGGLYGLYNTASGYLGDVLSYARLLALGLCTGVIASVINQLAAMIGNPIAFILIGLIGHTINFGINLIGTYVHTNRLQYVEFFGKFYEGGGTIFQPLNVKSKSFKFKEETQS